MKLLIKMFYKGGNLVSKSTSWSPAAPVSKRILCRFVGSVLPSISTNQCQQVSYL